MKKRIASLLLTFVMLLGMIPGTAFAAEEQPENHTPTVLANAPTELEVTVNEEFEIDLTEIFTDEDGDSLTYSVTCDTEAVDLTIDDSTCTGTVSTAGKYDVTFTAEDDNQDSVDHTVTVTATGGEEPVESSLSIRVGGNIASDAADCPLSPSFAWETTEYSTPILDYAAKQSQRYVHIKMDFPEGTAVTAKCGKSETETLTSGEWSTLQVNVGYSWSPTYSGCLSTGAYNEVIITVSKDGTPTEYTVTIPMQSDISNQSLTWKTNLAEAIYYTKNTDPSALCVEAQYNNRPLESTEEIAYQWYSTTAPTEDGTAIAGATTSSYSPSVTETGTSYYYVTATCGKLTATSKVIAVAVTDEEAPQSVSIVCDYPYTVPNDWSKALGGVSFVAKNGDTLTLKAVDENGKETPVVWPSSLGGGSLNVTSGSTVVYTVTSTLYSYVQVTSLYDSTIQSEEKAIQVEDYSVNQYNKTPTVTLSDDGQSAKTISAQGGLNGSTIWSYTVSPENAAELSSDQKEKANYLKFNALRPGTIQVSFDLDLNGDGVADGNGQTDTATLTINGIAVEDSSGNLTKTYLESSTAKPNPTMQLKALSSTENPAFTWSSADETIATVDENGLVTAKGVGSVIISASDGTYTGGIKVVVTSLDTPYFEQIDFVTANTWGTDLSNATWKTANFKPTTLDYTGLKMTKAEAGNLTLKDNTVYNTDKYEAVATYTNAFGQPMSIPIHSGDKTILNDLPFDTNVVKITLTDKTDAEKKTVYTFEITRPRDTIKVVAQSGISLNAVGRELLNTLYNGKAEGFVFRADADGVWNNTTYVVINNHYNYRTWAQSGLETFTLTVKGNSDYCHVRYSTDEGQTWTYLGQPTKSGKVTDNISFPARGEKDENPVVKVQIQFLDDKTYAANTAAGKDGFADSTPTTYNVWVEQLPSYDEESEILTAEVSSGDWYPAFDKNITNYRILVANGGSAPTLTFTVSEGASVKVDGVDATPTNGKYTLELSISNRTVNVKSSGGNVEKNYIFGYSQKSADSVPDKVTDFLCINSQYTNGNGNGYGIAPHTILTNGSELSLGNFGGYVTAYYENALTDDPNHPYGIDFYIDGNAFVDVSTGTGLGSMEPGQVWVSEDGKTWYALAGSEHYEDSTIWDYAVTYTKTPTGGIDWSDNQGNTMSSTHGRSFAWPRADIYALNDLATRNSFTLTGILLPCVDGTITGTDNFNSFSKGARFGYVDVLVMGRSNPYLANKDYKNESSGFDLAWAVDAEGNPVDVSGKAFHYVKVVTASNIIAGSANEKSTEVSAITRAEASENAVGKTSAPTGVTVSGGDKHVDIPFVPSQTVYSANLGDMEYVSIQVNGAAADDNIYVNNQRITADEAAVGIKVSSEKLVRVIVQNGEKEPFICLLKLTSTVDNSGELIKGVNYNMFGVDRVAETRDGKVYTASVGYRINEIQIKPDVDAGCTLSVNGAVLAENYPLQEGENTFTIQAVRGGVEHTVTLIVTREHAPVSTHTITVSFKLLGDDLHGDANDETGVHTLKENNLKTWIKKSSYTIPDTYTVLDLITTALSNADIDFVNEGGNYISEINGIGEFDNGPLSGWMYTLNGKHPGWGVAAQTLKNRDYVILHYTDDYTVEEGSEPWYPEDGEDDGTGNLTTSDKNDTNTKEETSTLLAPEVSTNTSGEAKAEVSTKDVVSALEKAGKDGTGTLEIAPVISGDATRVEVELPAEAVGKIAESGVALKVNTPVANITLPSAALSGLAGQTGSLSAGASADKEGGITVNISVGGEKVSDIPGGIVVGIPAEEVTPSSVLVIVNEDGNETIVKKSVPGDDSLTALLTGSASLKIVDNKQAFADTKDHWGESAIDFATSRGLFSGVGDNKFDPQGTMTRAMLATTLFRLEDGAAKARPGSRTCPPTPGTPTRWPGPMRTISFRAWATALTPTETSPGSRWPPCSTATPT